MAYLVDHPPARRQFRRPRRARVTGGIAVHTAENTPDQLGADAGAEAVARFIQGRSDPGSYHMLCDSDTSINLVPFDAEAYHDGTGSNPFSLSVSGATQAAKWNQLSRDYRERMVIRMAGASVKMALWVREERGIVVPGRWIPVADYRAGRPGFVRHADLDPSRRSDPGGAFPDDLFFEAYNDLYRSDDTTPDPEDDMTPDQLIAAVRVAVHGLLDEAANRSTPTGRQVADDLVRIVGDPASTAKAVNAYVAKDDRYSLYTAVQKTAEHTGAITTEEG